MRIEGLGGNYQAHSSLETQKIKSTEIENVKIEKSEYELTDREVGNEELSEGQDDLKQNEQDIMRAIEKANKHFRTYDRRLEFSIHDITKQILVKVINTEDESVIREIPSEKVLDMVAHMWEVAGILVDEKR